MFLYQDDLVSHIVKSFRFVERLGELSVERRRHIDAIKPHLVGINLFVPEATCARTRVRMQLFSQQVGCLLVTLVASLVVQREQRFPLVDLIKVVFFKAICPDIAIRTNEFINIAFDVIVVLLLTCFQPHLFD